MCGWVLIANSIVRSCSPSAFFKERRKVSSAPGYSSFDVPASIKMLVSRSGQVIQDCISLSGI